jgi:ribosomal protein S21
MPTVEVRGNLEQAITVLKRMVAKDGILNSIKARDLGHKASVRRKDKRRKAENRRKKMLKRMENRQ